MPFRNVPSGQKSICVKQVCLMLASFSKLETWVTRDPNPNTVFFSSVCLKNSYSGIPEIPTILFHSTPENSHKLHESEKRTPSEQRQDAASLPGISSSRLPVWGGEPTLWKASVPPKGEPGQGTRPRGRKQHKTPYSLCSKSVTITWSSSVCQAWAQRKAAGSGTVGKLLSA